MIPEFALRLICGLATMWCLAPRREITSGFFRIQMLIALGMGVLAAVTAGQADARDSDSRSPIVFGSAIILAVLSFLGSMMWTLERRRVGTVFVFLVLIVSSVGVGWLAGPMTGAIANGVADAGSVGHGNAFSSAWLIGAVTATMLLGHWYLTATGMPLTPLIQYNSIFTGAVLVRIVFASWTTWAEWDGNTLNGMGLLLILRWAGLLGPLVMAGLTMRILKYRNTQSATGVLYAATFLVFMGEMAAALLSRSQANLPGV